MLRKAVAIVAVAIASSAASAAELTREAIESATFAEGDALPSADEQSPLGFKLQALLDMAGISPGILDGYNGQNVEVAVSTFAEREGLESDGELDATLWDRLGGNGASVLADYTIAEEDVAGPFVEEIPDDFEDMAEMDHLGYTSPEELLAEKFHMHVDALAALNPDADFSKAGTEIVVAAVAEEPRDESAGKVARIEVDKAKEQVRGYDGDGKLLVAYPATIGSTENPSPSGTREVVTVVLEPEYWYTPELVVEGPDEALRIPPGPNGPVGSVWIDLNEKGYGIHGTPDPATIRKEQSHGCVRLANWDAEELAELVEVGTKVEFLDSPGQEDDD